MKAATAVVTTLGLGVALMCIVHFGGVNPLASKPKAEQKHVVAGGDISRQEVHWDKSDADTVLTESTRVAYFQRQGTKVYRTVQQQPATVTQYAATAVSETSLLQLPASNSNPSEDAEGITAKDAEADSSSEVDIADQQVGSSQQQLSDASQIHEQAQSYVKKTSQERSQMEESVSQEEQQPPPPPPQEATEAGSASEAPEAPEDVQSAESHALRYLDGLQTAQEQGTASTNKKIRELHQQLHSTTQQLRHDQDRSVAEAQTGADKAKGSLHDAKKEYQRAIGSAKDQAQGLLQAAKARASVPAPVKIGASKETLEQEKVTVQSKEHKAMEALRLMKQTDAQKLKTASIKAESEAKSMIEDAKAAYQKMRSTAEEQEQKVEDHYHAAQRSAAHLEEQVKDDANKELTHERDVWQTKLDAVKRAAEDTVDAAKEVKDAVSAARSS